MKLFWKFYTVLFFTIIAGSAYLFFNKNSDLEIYYNTAIIFSNWFLLPYFFNILNTLLGAVFCLYLSCYAFDLKLLPQPAPWFFFLRMLMDCVGHDYEFKYVQSGFAQSKFWGLLGLASLILPVLPSYVAQFRMTFIKA